MGRARVVLESLWDSVEAVTVLTRYGHEALYTEPDRWKGLWYVLAEGPGLPEWTQYREPAIIRGTEALEARLRMWQLTETEIELRK